VLDAFDRDACHSTAGDASACRNRNVISLAASNRASSANHDIDACGNTRCRFAVFRHLSA
jgi:hypothetical protein